MCIVGWQRERCVEDLGEHDESVGQGGPLVRTHRALEWVDAQRARLQQVQDSTLGLSAQDLRAAVLREAARIGIAQRALRTR